MTGTDKKRIYSFLLLGILVLGFILMVGGINFRKYADETIFVYYALKVPRLEYSNYIGVYTPILFGFYSLYFIAGYLLGFFKSSSDFLALYFYDFHSIFVFGRMVECLAGTFCAWLTYKAGKVLFNRRIGLMAALFLSVSYVHIYISQMVRGQAFALLFLMAAFYFIARIIRKPDYKNYILAGLFSGMALSVRINMLPILLTLVLVHFIINRENGKRILSCLVSGKLIIALIAVAGIYIASRPDIADELLMYKLIAKTYSGTTAGYLGSQSSTNSYIFYLKSGFPTAFGWTLAVLLGGGFLYAILNIKKRSNWLIISFFIPYLLMMGKSNLASWHYLFPVAPFVALLCAQVVFWAIDRFPFKRWNNLILAIVSIILILEGFFVIRKQNHLRNLPRTQIISQQWIFQNIPSGTKIAADSMGEQGPDLKRFPVIDVWIFNLSPEELEALYEERTSTDAGASVAIKYLMDNPPDPKYHLFNLGVRELVDLESLKKNKIEYAVVSSRVREIYDEPMTKASFPEFYNARMRYYRWLEEEGELIKTFSNSSDIVGPQIDIYRIKK